MQGDHLPAALDCADQAQPVVVRHHTLHALPASNKTVMAWTFILSPNIDMCKGGNIRLHAGFCLQVLLQLGNVHVAHKDYTKALQFAEHLNANMGEATTSTDMMKLLVTAQLGVGKVDAAAAQLSDWLLYTCSDADAACAVLEAFVAAYLSMQSTSSLQQVVAAVANGFADDHSVPMAVVTRLLSLEVGDAENH